LKTRLEQAQAADPAACDFRPHDCNMCPAPAAANARDDCRAFFDVPIHHRSDSS
jgi:hypothetical protein